MKGPFSAPKRQKAFEKGNESTTSTFFTEENFLQQNIFRDIQMDDPYTEHTLTFDQLSDIYPLSRLNCKKLNKSRGLNQEEAEMRLAAGESNLIHPWNSSSYRFRMFLSQFLNTFRILLLIAALICLLIFGLDITRCNELIMSMILGFILIFMCWLGYLEQAKSLKQISGFKIMVPVECSVVRNGKETRILANQLILGDLVWIRAGDRVPADIRLIYTNDLRMETSWIIGIVEPLEYVDEPAPRGMNVLEAQNVAFSGSSCTAGEGLGLVIRTGGKTLIGKLLDVISKQKHERSCLKTEHNKFVHFITIISLVMATLTFLFGLYVNNFTNIASTLINGFLIVLVANVPQGLPVTLTAQLLIVVRRLAKKCDGMTLKSSDTADTLGMTSMMMTDKSGVLTCNALRVTDVWYCGQFCTAAELLAEASKVLTQRKFCKLDDKKTVDQNGTANEFVEHQLDLQQLSSSWDMLKHLEEVLEVMSMCSNARIDGDFPPALPTIDDKQSIIGDTAAQSYLTTQSLSVWPTYRRRTRRSSMVRSHSECSDVNGADDSDELGVSRQKISSSIGERCKTFEVATTKEHLSSGASNSPITVPTKCTVKITLSDFPSKDDLTLRRIEKLGVQLNSASNKSRSSIPTAISQTTLTHRDMRRLGGSGIVHGRPIDAALLQFVDQLASVEQIRSRYEFVYEIPFSSYRRYHLVIVADRNESSQDCTTPHVPIFNSSKENRKQSCISTLQDKNHPITEEEENRVNKELNQNTMLSNSSVGRESVLDVTVGDDDDIITYRLMVKGAPEELIRNCDTIITDNGTMETLSDEHLMKFEEAYLKYGEQGKTCLAFATFQFDAYSDALFHSSSCESLNSGGSNSINFNRDPRYCRFPESGWCFLGMVAMYDPLRPNITNAVRRTQRAGIRLFMVTGDHPTTAEALARQMGFGNGIGKNMGVPSTSVAMQQLEKPAESINAAEKKDNISKQGDVAKNQQQTKTKHNNNDTASAASSGYSSAVDTDSERAYSSSNASELAFYNEFNGQLASDIFGNELAVIHGDSLDSLSEPDLKCLLKRVHVVFARITPSQKLELVKQCQRLGYVVTLTGDGLMDALALKQSDIGVAVDSAGSVFAKEASDIVIAENDLSNLVRGVEEARLLFDNLKKTVAYTLSHLLPELLPILLSFVFGFPLGLNSLQVLTIDLLTEIPPSVALIFEPPERNIMKRPPRKRTAHLVTPQLLFYAYVIAGNIISLGCVLSYLTVFWINGFTLSDLGNTTNVYWHDASPNMTASTSQRVFSAADQVEIRAQANSAWHITLVLSQIFHSFVCTTRRSSLFHHGIHNEKLLAAIVFEVILLTVLVFVPFFHNIIEIRPPPFCVWLFPIGVGIVLLAINEIRKYFIRRRPKHWLVRIFKW